MGIIKQLPASVINQIAAGEVIERPASVVKELLENAIDAGASRIDVTVERGGKDLIRIADNGRGISAEDLPVAFLPHATSKLAEAEDLFRISTLGFRGEALAAIAEVSRVTCQTRPADSEEGSEIQIDAGISGAVKACACSPGTVIEVRNLFANTPVRRTFLKSDSTEASHVTEMFSRIALAHPTVHLTFRSAGKLVHDLPAVTGINERVAVFFGRELAESLLWVESQIDDIHLWGYVAHPSQSRSTAKGQFLFVGGRYVRDRSLSHALTEAYRGLLMVGRSPLAFLHLEIPPDQVDVNVHPSKVEVRFRDNQRIYSQLLAMVRKTFLASDLHSKLQANAETIPTPESVSSVSSPVSPSERFNLTSPAQARQEVASWFKPGESAVTSYSSSVPAEPFRSYPAPGYAGGPAGPPAWTQSLSEAPPRAESVPFDEFQTQRSEAEYQASVAPREESVTAPAVEGEPVSAAALESTPIKAFQVHDSYLVAETDEGMMVIDQHALHERILFEEIKNRVERGGVEAQRLLVPEPVDLPATEAAVVLEQAATLRSLGFEIEPFGGDTVLMHSVPAMFRSIAPERILKDLAEHFATRPLPPTADAVLADLMNMIACKAAVKAGQRLSTDEITALIERRHLVADSHHCPHGRPTALIFTKSELERQFGRI